MEYQHHIPIHLEEEDKFIFNLTGRQTLIMAIGLALGYTLASDFDFSRLSGVLVGTFAFLAVVGLSAVVAFVQYHHRNVEQWALIALVYVTEPKYYVRGHVMIKTQSETKPYAQEAQQEEQEEW